MLMAIVSAARVYRPTMAISDGVVEIRAVMSLVVERLGIAEDSSEEFAIDGLDLSSRAELEGVCGNAVGVSQAPLRVLVDESECVGVEGVSVGASALDSMGDIIGGVSGLGLTEGDSGVDSRAEGAVLGEREPLFHLGQADENDGQ